MLRAGRLPKAQRSIPEVNVIRRLTCDTCPPTDARQPRRWGRGERSVEPSPYMASPVIESRQSCGGQSNDDRPGDLIIELLPDEVLHVIEQTSPG
jgi:hypothetical protein